MTEVLKVLKNVMIVNAIVFLILSVLYIGLINIFLTYIALPSFDHLYSFTFGGCLLIFGIFTLVVQSRGNANQSKLLMELIIAWQIAMIFTSFFAIQIMSSYTPTPIVMIWVNNIVFICLIVLNIIVYRKSR